MSRVLVDSGIDWIGKIPANWNIQPLGLYLKERKEKVSDIDYEPLSVTKNGIVPQLENAAKSDAHDQRKKVCKFDFVINSRSDRKQSCGLSYLEGSVSLINTVLKIYNYYPEYIKYALDNNMFSEEFYRNGHGIVADLWTTKYSEMKHIRIPEPNYDEQKNIANFLDKQSTKIDEIINDNNREVELLEEYKRTILKNELGNKVGSKKYRIKNIANLKGRIGWQGLTTADYIEEGPYLITGVDFNESKGSINWESCVHISEERYEEAPEIHVLPNDLLITKDGTIGKLAIISENREASLNSGVMLIRIKDKSVCNVKYLYYLLKSDYFWDWYNSSQRGSSTIKHLYQEQFYNFSFFLPDLAHQEKVIKKIDDQFFKLDQVINYRKQIIEKLEEYKRSLIYECVTGKREV